MRKFNCCRAEPSAPRRWKIMSLPLKYAWRTRLVGLTTWLSSVKSITKPRMKSAGTTGDPSDHFWLGFIW